MSRRRRRLIAVVMGIAKPTITIVLTSYTAATDTATMTITASKEVTGFEVGDITISAGGTLANFATADNIVFTVDWTLAAGANTMDIAAGVCQGLSGKDNVAATQYGIGAEQTATLKPAEAIAEDIYIQDSTPTTNYATTTYMYVGEWYPAATLVVRGLIRFTEVSNIPTTAQIKTATLQLYLSGDQTNTIRTCRVFRSLRAWVEAQATWNIWSTGNNWATAGAFGAADCEQTDIGSLEFSATPTINQYYNFVLTPSKVQEWVDGTLTNNGLLVKMDTESDDTLAFSSATDGATKRPTLEVVYRVPFSTAVAVNHVQLLDCPVAADQMGFEELGGLLYYVCGRAVVNHSQKVYAYNPANNTWTEKADYPIACQSLVLKAVGTKLYGIGGHNSQLAIFYAKVYEYDPDANTWTEKLDMPTTREDFGAAVVGTKIYCFGGLTTNYNPTKVLEIYDTEANTWDATKASMPGNKHFGDFGAAYNGKIYAIGSSNTFADYPILHPVQVVWEYDPVADTWTERSYLPNPMSYKEAVVLGDKIYCVSGCTFSTTTYTNVVYVYDPAANTWEQKANAPYAARGAGLAVYNSKIYMCGGFNGSMLNYLYRLGY